MDTVTTLYNIYNKCGDDMYWMSLSIRGYMSGTYVDNSDDEMNGCRHFAFAKYKLLLCLVSFSLHNWISIVVLKMEEFNLVMSGCVVGLEMHNSINPFSSQYSQGISL